MSKLDAHSNSQPDSGGGGGSSQSAPAKDQSATPRVYAGVFELLPASTGWGAVVGAFCGLTNPTTPNAFQLCFLNAALQVLMNTAPLTEWLRTHPPTEDCDCFKATQFCVACFLRDLGDKCFAREEPYLAGKFYINHRLKKFRTTFVLGKQQDTHEFLVACVERLQESVIFNTADTNPFTSPVYQIFSAEQCSKISTCTCGNTPSPRIDPVFDLSLTLSVDGHHFTTLDEALDHHFAEESLGEYRCENCGKATDAKRHLSLRTTPKILFIQLKRFLCDATSGLTSKITSQIHYPEILDLARFTPNPTASSSYALYAVITHLGETVHSGHYISYVKSPDRRWRKMDDETATVLSTAPLHLKDAYILAYSKQVGSGGGGVGTSSGATTGGADLSMSVDPVHEAPFVKTSGSLFKPDFSPSPSPSHWIEDAGMESSDLSSVTESDEDEEPTTKKIKTGHQKTIGLPSAQSLSSSPSKTAIHPAKSSSKTTKSPSKSTLPSKKKQKTVASNSKFKINYGMPAAGSLGVTKEDASSGSVSELVELLVDAAKAKQEDLKKEMEPWEQQEEEEEEEEEEEDE